MTMKNDAKFLEEFSCFKINMRNFDPSNQKTKKRAL